MPKPTDKKNPSAAPAKVEPKFKYTLGFFTHGRLPVYIYADRFESPCPGRNNFFDRDGVLVATYAELESVTASPNPKYKTPVTGEPTPEQRQIADLKLDAKRSYDALVRANIRNTELFAALIQCKSHATTSDHFGSRSEGMRSIRIEASLVGA